MIEQILLENNFKHIRTFGNRKEYERTIGNHKLRVRPASKSVLVTYEYEIGLKKEMISRRVKEEEAIQLVIAFSCMEILYA